MSFSWDWLFRGSPLALAALDDAGICRAASDAWRKRFGLAPEGDPACAISDLLGADAAEEVAKLVAAELGGADEPREVLLPLSGIAGPTGGALCTWRVRPLAGEPAWILLAITEQAGDDQAAEQLDRLQSAYQLLLDAAGEGIYGLDCHGRATFVNRAATRILGWRPEEIIGRPLHDIHHHSRADGTPYPRGECPIYAAFKDGKVHRIDDEVFWKTDGTSIPVEYTSTPIREHDELRGAVVVFHDISGRKRIEREREAAYEEIKRLKEQLELERDYLRDEVNIAVSFGAIVGESQALQRTLAQIDAVAQTPANVLILGESGVGKEMVARAIHAHSSRASHPLVKVNCASIPKELFESEFFGHVRGAFTGALRDRVGRFELANGGTLFLDEVGEIPPDLQGKLLRALQEHAFERVGDERTVTVDVRVVAATNRKLEDEVKAGRFREDLYYRLSVFPIEVPPLRERLDDVVPLAMQFLESICRELGREPLRLTRRHAARLRAHPWPGNVRELQNIIERAVILSPRDRLRLDLALPGEAEGTAPTPPVDDQPSGFLTEAEFRSRERANMIAVLRHAGWRVSGPGGAAERLGLKPSTFAYRMKTFGIRPPRSA